MPSSATITSFFTFVANTKARASQVNTNFSNFRGHSIPINTDTATASTLTHDLGSSEHRWRTAYVRDVNFPTLTTTGSVVATSDYSATSSAFLVNIDGSEAFRVKSNGYSGFNAFTMNVTTSAAKGNFAMSPTITGAVSGATSTPTLITATSITIVTNGRPVRLGLISAAADATAGDYGIVQGRAINLWFYKDGSPLQALAHEVSNLTATMSLILPASSYNGIDYDCTAGTHTYDVRTVNCTLDFVRFYAYEI